MARISAPFQPATSRSCLFDGAFKWCSRIPTDSHNPRFTAARVIADPILRLGDIKGSEAVRHAAKEPAR